MRTPSETITFELAHSIGTLRVWAKKFRDEGRGDVCRFGGHHEVNGAADAIDTVLSAIEFGYMDMDGTLHERAARCFCNPKLCEACGEGNVHLQGVYGGLARACDNPRCKTNS